MHAANSSIEESVEMSMVDMEMCANGYGYKFNMEEMSGEAQIARAN